MKVTAKQLDKMEQRLEQLEDIKWRISLENDKALSQDGDSSPSYNASFSAWDSLRQAIQEYGNFISTLSIDKNN